MATSIVIHLDNKNDIQSIDVVNERLDSVEMDSVQLILYLLKAVEIASDNHLDKFKQLMQRKD